MNQVAVGLRLFLHSTLVLCSAFRAVYQHSSSSQKCDAQVELIVAQSVTDKVEELLVE